MTRVFRLPNSVKDFFGSQAGNEREVKEYTKFLKMAWEQIVQLKDLPKSSPQIGAFIKRHIALFGGVALFVIVAYVVFNSKSNSTENLKDPENHTALEED